MILLLSVMVMVMVDVDGVCVWVTVSESEIWMVVVVPRVESKLSRHVEAKVLQGGSGSWRGSRA